MKILREQIKKEIKILMEKSYPMPPEIKYALKNTLGLNPIRRYINGLKAANTLPPSYRAFLYNGRFLDFYMQDTFLQLKLDHKVYDLENMEDLNLAKKHINKLLTNPIPTGTGEGGTESEEDSGDTMEPESPTPEEEV